MAKSIIETLLKTVADVQKKNQASKTEETADPSVFNLIREKLQNLEAKTQESKATRGKSPKSILDLIKKEVAGVRSQNKKDANVATAPKSIFDSILKKIEDKPMRQASTGVKKIVEDFNLDVSKIPSEILQQVQGKYAQDRKVFDQQYAQAIFDLSKQYK